MNRSERILSSREAEGREELAQHLVGETELNVAQATALLGAAAKPSLAARIRSRYGKRMATSGKKLDIAETLSPNASLADKMRARFRSTR